MARKIGFLKSNLSPGMILNIIGKMGSGKTNYATVIIQRAIGRFYYIFTNILFFDENEIEEAKREGLLDKDIDYRKLPAEVQVITVMSELLLGLNKVSKKRKSIVILDEASLFGGGVIAKEKRVIWLKNFVTSFLRKAGGALVLITQDKNSVAPMLRDELPGTEVRLVRNIKTGQRTEYIYIIPEEFGITGEPKLVDIKSDVPRAIYPYDSNAPAKFEFDLDFDEFMNRAGNFNSLKLRTELPQIVTSLRNEYLEKKKKEKKKQVSKRELVEMIVNKDGSLRPAEIKEVLAKYFGISMTTNYISVVRKETLTYNF